LEALKTHDDVTVSLIT